MMHAGRRWTWFRIAETAILLAFAGLTVRNALVFPAIAGVDASEHLRYARDLVFEHRLGTSASYYAPPGWYAIAGELLRLGDFLDLASVEQPVQLLSAGAAVASAILLLGVVRHAFPARPWLRIWALAAFCTAPVVFRLAAMPHPQALVLLLTTVALFLLVRLLGSGRWGVVSGLLLGLALGAAQLVRSVGLWIYAVAALALVVAIVVAHRDRRRRVAATACVALVLGALLPLPWYVYLQVEYGDPLFGGRPEIRQGAPPAARSFRTLATASAEPRASRASLTFFTATGLPESITHPYRGVREPAFLPVVLADTWGDYYGQWRWGIPDATLDPPNRRRLMQQVLVGLPLTFVTAIGLVALVALVARSPRRRVAQLPIAALPLVGLASLVLYAWRYPSPDGDTVKALFLLPAAPAFAVAFGFAVDVARPHLPLAVRTGLGVLLVVALAVCAEFGVWVA